ncbi:MAG: hypothetical protein U0174_05825 [Polyangiaceae bacterium]
MSAEQDATETPKDDARETANVEEAELPSAASAEAEPAKSAEHAAKTKSRWLDQGRTSRRILIALGLYVVTTAVFAILAGDRMLAHSPYNHFAQLADAWVHGRHDLVNGPPSYAGNNDFAVFGGKTYISFPPFPAMLMLPLVWIAGSPENFRDAQFVVWLAGIAPAALFLTLEKLRRMGKSERNEGENALFALLFAFGTVYFFTAVQGTVWFAGHVVGAGLLGLYLLCALDGERPFTAGMLLGFIFLTRVTMTAAGLLFFLEVLRTCRRSDAEPSEDPGTLFARIDRSFRLLDVPRAAKKLVVFAVPLLACLAFASATNYARFKTMDPTAFGHEHLTVAWRDRIQHWGLFGYHYFPKNLGIFLTSLPWLPARGTHVPGAAPFLVNEHGLAIWFTTPLYLWLLWPKRRDALLTSVLVTAAIPCIFNLCYQNSGWSQFGYRFSNDYASLLFVALAMGGRKLGALWKAASVWSVAWNLFGAASFERGPYQKYYFHDGSQTIVHQPD